MATILLRVPMEATPDKAYDAVASQEGVRGWWSTHSDGPGGPGSTLKVGFPDLDFTFDFEVTDATPGERVAWHCISGPPEWIDTDVSFEVQTDDDGNTSLLFAHDGWKTTEQSFPFIAYSWAQILPRLKKLAETGERDPYFNF